MSETHALRASVTLLALSFAGCSGCRDDERPAETDAGPASSATAFVPPSVEAQPHAELPVAAAPEAIVFRDRHMLSGGRRKVALPKACRQVQPQQVGTIPPEASIAPAARSRPALVVTAPADGDLPARAGILDLGQSGAAPAPLALPATTPKLTARAAEGWLMLSTMEGDGGTVPVLWTAGAPGAESLGAGDGFRSVDLACTADRCALLTTRRGTVLRAGATVWTRPLSGGAFERWDIEPAEADASPEPFAFARVAEDVVVAFEHGGKAEFWTLRKGRAPEHTATLPAPGGLAAATALPTPVALSRNRPLPEKGCSPGLGLTLERPDKPAVPLSAPVQPTLAAIHPLSKGALVTWLTPLRCEADQPGLRRVLYALVIDEQGEPVGSVMPVSDTWEYAVTTQGDEVHLWLRGINPPDGQPPELTWLQLSCSGAAQ